jgi:hypothetical protein
MRMLQIAEGDMGAFLDRRTKVWLECNGEPYDFRSLCFVEFLDAAGEFELVSFKCPRCGARHQSLRFL